MMSARNVAVLGATGSIGTQALDVIARHPDRFRVCALTAHEQAEQLFSLVRTYRPAMACLTAGEVPLPEDVRFCDWRFGADALSAAALESGAQDVLAAVSGMAGLQSTLDALKAGKRVLLANKETLVAGGALVMNKADAHPGSLLPVDSEHSAIFQCLQAAGDNLPSRLWLTASGGPFRTASAEQMERATVAQALGHPTWRMGKKITIDSASMFNKALEIIEARWLFRMDAERVRVLVHPQSIVHSMVEFADGAVLAQMGVPDMRVPILYALAYPDRLESGAKPLSWMDCPPLTFEPPDVQRFPAIPMAYDVLKAEGAAACVLNAANEIAAHAFLNERLSFGGIARVVRRTLDALGSLPARSLSDVLEADARARAYARETIQKIGGTFH